MLHFGGVCENQTYRKGDARHENLCDYHVHVFFQWAILAYQRLNLKSPSQKKKKKKTLTVKPSIIWNKKNFPPTEKILFKHHDFTRHSWPKFLYKLPIFGGLVPNHSHTFAPRKTAHLRRADWQGPWAPAGPSRARARRSRGASWARASPHTMQVTSWWTIWVKVQKPHRIHGTGRFTYIYHSKTWNDNLQ